MVMGTVFSEQKSHGLCEYRLRRKVLKRDTDTDTHIDRHTYRQTEKEGLEESSRLSGSQLPVCRQAGRRQCVPT